MKETIGPYVIGKQIGSGAFASVFEAVHSVTQDKVAVKVISKSKLNPKLQANLKFEISLLKSLDHPNVVKLIDVETFDGDWYLIMEFCKGGDLSGYLKLRGKCSEEFAREIIRQVAAGLQFMNARNIMHRDLKPQNLLLTNSSPPVVKIADFGFARTIQEGSMAETMCGSPLYMAPEILRFKQYDAKVDLWAVGAVLFEIVTGQPPFPAATPNQLVEKIRKFDITWPRDVSQECLDLLKGLLVVEPLQRMNHDQFFASPFVKPKVPTLSETASVLSHLRIDTRPEEKPEESNVLASVGVKSPLFSLSELFGANPTADIDEIRRLMPSVEMIVRHGLLMCDVAESKWQQAADSTDMLQSMSLMVKGLDMLQSAMSNISAPINAARNLQHERKWSRLIETHCEWSISIDC